MPPPGQQPDVAIKRAYDPPSSADGVRILVDRLWPCRLAKDAAQVDRWLRELAPTTELRRWFGHDPTRWDEFRRRYADELAAQGERLGELRQVAHSRRLTLLFAARDASRNNAAALREILVAGGQPAGEPQ